MFTRRGMDVLVLGEYVIAKTEGVRSGGLAAMQIGPCIDNRLALGDQLRQVVLQYKWWWLSPIILMVLWLAGMAIFAQSSAHPAFRIDFSGDAEKFYM